MRARTAATIVLLAVVTAGCNKIDTGPSVVSSVSIDPLASPSIVAGDSLRDSLGIARPVTAGVFNPAGTPLGSVAFRFHAGDPGVSVDSITGYVVADTARSTPVRLFAVAAGLQTTPDTVFIVPRPDSVFAVSAIDSVVYVVADSNTDFSGALQLQLSSKGATLLPVRSYLVSYTITYPTDTTIAQLYTRDALHRSSVDTTQADGTSGRRVRVQPTRLANPTDSVVVLASARYLGALVSGSPVRFVVTVKPHS